MKRKPLDAMSEEEALEWVRDLRERLQRKQVREQAYLARRAARGVRTPTDEAYEQDQELEHEILALLNQLEGESRDG